MRTAPGGPPRAETVATAAAHPGAGGSLWRHPDFLRLWSAQTVSVFGDNFTALALPLIAVVTLHATPGQMGLLTALERLPFLILGLLAGVWVDRVRRRPLLIAGDVGRGLVLLTIPAAAAAGVLGMPQLCAVGILVAVGILFFDVAEGRMNTTMRFLVWGIMPVGGLLGGALGDALGLRAAMAISAVGGMTAFLWVLGSPVRRLRAIPEAADA